GITYSSAFPVTPGAFQTTKKSQGDAFVSKLTPDGSAFDYSTYLGGNKYDGAGGVVADGNGGVYVGGCTEALDFPAGKGFQPAQAGNGDAFLVEFAPGGNALRFASYLGGASQDGALSVGADRFGNACVVGLTGSNNFPTVKPLQPNNAGPDDAFVTKVS